MILRARRRRQRKRSGRGFAKPLSIFCSSSLLLLARIFLLHSLSADPLTEFGLIGCFIIKGEEGSNRKIKRSREKARGNVGKRRMEYRIAIVFGLPLTSVVLGWRDFRVDSSSNHASFGEASFEGLEYS